MFRDAFYWIFNMSISASITGIIILLIRKIRRIPKRAFVILWIIPFTRMVIPFGISWSHSLMSYISRLTAIRTVPLKSVQDLGITRMNFLLLVEDYMPHIIYKKAKIGTIFHIASYVWLSVLFIILLTWFILYLETVLFVKKSHRISENIYTCDKVVTPAVYGIFCPKIILPVRDVDNQYVIHHEKMHIRRKDNLWRLLAMIAVAFQWFNPLSWFFLKMFLIDLELACDEMAIADYDDAGRKEYAKTLLDHVEKNGFFVSGFGSSKIRTRIENIITYKRISIFTLILFALLNVIICVILLTNAR